MTYTRQEWAHDLLALAGNHSQTVNVVKWVAAWSLCETPLPEKALHPPAQYNLLNAHTPMARSTEYHDGVQNYLTYMDGLQATVIELMSGAYPYLTAALTLNEESLLGFAMGVTDATLIAEVEKWSGGKGYGKQIFPFVGQGLDDRFPGENTYQKERMALRVWESTRVFLAACGASAPYHTTIAVAWRHLWLDGKYPGPPLTPLYLGNDADGEQVGFQEFTNLHAVLHQDGGVDFYTLTNALAHPVKIFVPRDISVAFDGFTDAFSDGQPTSPQAVLSGELETPDRVAAQKRKPKGK